MLITFTSIVSEVLPPHIQMRMEGCVRSLQEEIDMLRALTCLNSERLEYEIHVLSKHEEENSVVKAEQKRKITCLQDRVLQF